MRYLLMYVIYLSRKQKGSQNSRLRIYGERKKEEEMMARDCKFCFFLYPDLSNSQTLHFEHSLSLPFDS